MVRFRYATESPYLRASFSLAPVESFDEGFRRLADVIRAERAEQVPGHAHDGAKVHKEKRI